MKKLLVVLPLTILAACTGRPVNEQGYITTLSDSVLELAAPYQDLTRVRVLPEDGCYWYLHDGPVEATLLPLRTREGRPICTPESVELRARQDASG